MRCFTMIRCIDCDAVTRDFRPAACASFIYHLLLTALLMLLLLQVQALLGAKHAVAFDITAACSGFVVALNTAAQFIRTGTYKNIVVIGADCLSRYVDWRDRSEPPLRLPCIT